MDSYEIQFIRKVDDYSRALNRLIKAAHIVKSVSEVPDMMKDVETVLKEGMVKRFEFTCRSVCDVMACYLENHDCKNLHGMRDVFAKAAEMKLIEDEAWMKMSEDVEKMSKFYSVPMLDKVSENITNIYIPLLEDFRHKMMTE